MSLFGLGSKYVAASSCFLLFCSVVDPLVDSKPIGMYACCVAVFFFF
jgi:hypothetical protein